MRLRESNLPGEIVWQFSMNLLTRPDHFSGPVALRKIVRRREVVLIFVGIGYGRVPSASPIQCARDEILRTARFSAGHSNSPVPHDSGVCPPLQSKQER
jgi:hypothetical protein